MPKGRSGKRHVLVTKGRTTYIGGGRRTYSRVGGFKTKKGAYKKAQKNNFARKRAPLVEVKRKTDEDIRSVGFFSGTGSIDDQFPDRTAFEVYTTPHVQMDPVSYLAWSQGLGQAQHIGQAVNVKYTNMKIQVRFPQPSVTFDGYSGETPQVIPQQPMNYELVWGWVPAPLQLTGTTDQPINTVDLNYIKSHINDRVTDYWNSRKDKLRFIPRKDATLRIIGRKKVRPDMRRTSTLPPASEDNAGETTVGSIPDYFTEISWNHKNKKLWLEQTGNINGDSDLIGMVPNYSWLPFCTLVNWNWDEIVTDDYNGKKLECPSVAWNSITYFSDS